jgi:flagellar biosynthesis protein FlhG
MTASPSSGRGRLIAIASGKGGVGKTWFTITLAHAMARRGRRVLVFDGDLGLANVDIQLGLTPERDLGAVLAGTASLADAVLHHAEGGFDILAGRSGSGALAGLDSGALDAILAILRQGTETYELVLLDLGAGLERPVRYLAARADTLLVLATEEPTSLTDAYAVLKLHAADRSRWNDPGEVRVIVNQAVNRTAGERTYETLRRACAAFLGQTPRFAGVIRRDERIPETIRRQALLLTRYPTCGAAEDIEQVCCTLS